MIKKELLPFFIFNLMKVWVTTLLVETRTQTGNHVPNLKKAIRSFNCFFEIATPPQISSGNLNARRYWRPLKLSRWTDFFISQRFV